MRPRARRVVQVGVAYALALLAVAVGVGIEFGPGWALIAGGVLTGGSVAVLVDVDKPAGGGG
ncbi:hypothetical protein [Nocardiopsis trehalosi]|uniref:hypothetical protein n=1 Tax=Nocardiopsis trehalosi TaxID=109329 RepID=UPI00082B04D1|nr:hypothetical protein [Nocardiopsis trehalosi]